MGQADFNLDRFVALKGQSFTLTLGDDSVPAILTEASPMGTQSNPDSGLMPFSVVFETTELIDVEQQIIQVSNDSIGELSLFLVPLGPGSNGMQLEAVFT